MPKQFAFKIRQLALAAALWVLAGCLVACSPPASTMLQDTSCAPPCWQKITPGVTNKVDVVTILTTLAEVDATSIVNDAVGGDGTGIFWVFADDRGDKGGHVAFKNGIVSLIELFPKDGALNMGDAIQKLGQPESVLAVYRTDDSSLTIYVLYPQKGYALLDRQNGFRKDQHAEVKSDRQVKAVFYFTPALFDEMMTAGLIGNLKPGQLRDGMRPWQGFGEVKYIEK